MFQPSTTPDDSSTAPVSDVLTAALAYAESGWAVFPLRPGDKRPAFPDHAEHACTGRDLRRARAGRHIKWEERATTDPDRIRAAWGSPEHRSGSVFGLGIACGPSGLLVVDLDVPKPGEEVPGYWADRQVRDGTGVLAALCTDTRRAVPHTFTARTARGGWHIYFRQPTDVALPNTGPGSPNRLGWMIDTRGHGGYVVAPPTRTTTGVYRIVRHEEPAPLPGWLTARLRPAPLPPKQPITVRLADVSDTRRRAYLQAALNGAVRAVLTSADHGHNAALYGAAVQLGQLVAGGELDAETVRAVLLTAGCQVGQSQTEAAKTIASGLRRGEDRPRSFDTTTATAATTATAGAATRTTATTDRSAA
ncbi:bifunctional DNA primase/polymerase-like protein [Kineococcus xinjiangensis]|uniref:Bifunctional DNA primase/polymerase-like protein n=1 Tax=Kineococcus xinjiangensis TaxID=512762 RepID=A0A2S6IC70_9ACTN|nr:bifunctional DNA primase/polymerase [Kineococcus xinjiangensis]PPK90845.1 bifunctional DNA primase/polymerase-like protein [Kineococcus xinjiangensis]